MKKKLLLIALPALMALSGCANVQKEQSKVEQEQPAVEFEEDTVAHEEIFGEAVEAKQPTIRKMDDLGTGAAYKVGYQLHFEENGEGTADDRLSIRFIAAINSSYGSMTWSRGVARGDGDLGIGFGNEKYGSSDKLVSTVVYPSLCNGTGNDVMEAEQGAYAAYTGFIVYSIRNIKYESYKDSYIGVSLTLHPTEGEDVVTPVYAVKVERNPLNLNESLYSFSFENGNQGYFLNGTFNNIKKNILADYPTRNDNRATFTADFTADDEFLIVKKTTTEFRVWNSSSIPNAAAVNSHFEATDSGERIKAADGGHMRLYLNNDEPKAHLYASNTFTSTGTALYIRGEVNKWAETPEGYELLSDGDDCQGVIYNVSLPVGDFKIGNSDWSKNWGFADGYKNKRIVGPVESRFTGNYDVENSNIYCNTADTYNIMLKNDHTIYIWEA